MLTFNMLLGATSLILALVYCFGSLPYVNFDENAAYDAFTANNTAAARLPRSDPSLWFVGGMAGFMNTLPLATRGYAGVEAVILMTSLAKDPKITIPRGLTAAVVTLIFCFIFLSFVGASLPPGMTYTINQEFYMNVGYERIFHCTDRTAVLLIVPGQIAMAWGFIVPSGKLLHCMAQSNLLPSWFGLNSATSYNRAIVFGCVLSFIWCIVAYLKPAFSSQLQNVAVLSACVTYFAQLQAFYMLRTKFSTIERDFHSPFGIPGAILAAIVFALTFISVAFFQATYVPIYTLLVITAVLSCYYYTFAKATQVFSVDEQKHVFRIHVINFNCNRQSRMRKGQRKDQLNTSLSGRAHKLLANVISGRK
jgi:ethanolamine permease